MAPENSAPRRAPFQRPNGKHFHLPLTDIVVKWPSGNRVEKRGIGVWGGTHMLVGLFVYSSTSSSASASASSTASSWLVWCLTGWLACWLVVGLVHWCWPRGQRDEKFHFHKIQNTLASILARASTEIMAYCRCICLVIGWPKTRCIFYQPTDSFIDLKRGPWGIRGKVCTVRVQPAASNKPQPGNVARQIRHGNTVELRWDQDEPSRVELSWLRRRFAKRVKLNWLIYN